MLSLSQALADEDDGAGGWPGPFIHLLLGFFLGDAEHLLNLAYHLLPTTVDLFDLVIGKVSPLGTQDPFHLVPHTLDLILIHLKTAVVSAYSGRGGKCEWQQKQQQGGQEEEGEIAIDDLHDESFLSYGAVLGPGCDTTRVAALARPAVSSLFTSAPTLDTRR